MKTTITTQTRTKNINRCKTALLVTEDDLLLDLAHHNVPPSLLIEFSEKIVQPYYHGNLTAALQDLLQKALTEQEFIHTHTTHVQNCVEPWQPKIST